MSAFHDLLAENVGAAYARQLAFADFLGNRNWNINLTEGVVRFGQDLKYPVQLIGSEATGDSTWLWAWGNEASNLPEAVLKSCQELRSIGEVKGVRELTERMFPLTVTDGHTLSLLASGLNGKSCYYRGPYQGGAAFFLVLDVPEQILKPVPTQRAITILTEMLSKFPLPHKPMGRHFLQSQGFELQETSQNTTATRDGDSITLEFDELGRASKIGAHLKPQPTSQPKPTTKPWWQFWK